MHARGRVLTDARRNMRSALLVASGASVASNTGYTVFAGTLAAALVTGLSRSSNRMTITRCDVTNNSVIYIFFLVGSTQILQNIFLRKQKR